MELRGTFYLPVTITFSRADWRFAMHWYKKDYNEQTQKLHYYYYPHFFVSPFVTGLDTTREKDFPQAKYIVADSGGYQLGVGQRPNVSVLDVLRWQEQIADVALTVDEPAYKFIAQEQEGKSQPVTRYYTDKHFEGCMRISNANAVKMLEAQENPKMQLWAVIQGGNYNDLQKWYKDLIQYHEFKGYSLPMASTFTPKQKEDWIGQLKFAKELNINFHFLGRCEPLLVLVLAKMSQITGKLYTYDTATAATGLMLGKYHEPLFMSSLSFSKKKPETRAKFDPDGPPPCDCPVCSKHTYQEMIDGYYTLLLHNVYIRKRFNACINVMIQDDEIFAELLNKFLRLQPIYQKNKDKIKERINNLLFDEPLKKTSVEQYLDFD